MNRPTCETCPFWANKKWGFPNEDKGECHVREPSRSVGTLSLGVGVWPETRKDDFCGQHPQFADFKFQWRQAEITALDEKAKANRCDNMLHAARCLLHRGHDGHHQHTGIVGPLEEPERCSIFVGGKRCGKQIGHGGKHVWERGD